MLGLILAALLQADPGPSCSPTDLRASLHAAVAESRAALGRARAAATRRASRARWSKLLPSLTLLSSVEDRHPFMSTRAAPPLDLSLDEGSDVLAPAEMRTAESVKRSRDLVVLAGWDLSDLVFHSGETDAAAAARLALRRQMERSQDLAEIEHEAYAALDQLEHGVGPPGPACLAVLERLARIRVFE